MSLFGMVFALSNNRLAKRRTIWDFCNTDILKEKGGSQLKSTHEIGQKVISHYC